MIRAGSKPGSCRRHETSPEAAAMLDRRAQMARTKRPAKPALAIKVGDCVLLGGTHASYPWHWFHGDILWIGSEEAVIQRFTQNGQPYVQMIYLTEIRAIGQYSDLSAIREQSAKAVKELQRVVDEAESALGRARDALFNRLDELAAGGLKIIPADFAAMDDDRAARRAVQEIIETEDEARAKSLGASQRDYAA